MSPKVRSVLLTFFLNSGFRRLITDPEATLAPYVHTGQTVADIGCGPGFFTLALAKLVGPNGRVIAADVDQYMLDKLVLNAKKQGLAGRIIAHKCEQGSLGLNVPVDFVLCFWMAHEVRSQDRFFAEIHSIMKPGSSFLLTEPIAHESKRNFHQTVSNAQKAGFVAAAELKIRGSYSRLFTASSANHS